MCPRALRFLGKKMTVISFDNISLSFGASEVLDKISFGLNEGDRLGIVGVNGAGKTSLMKIVTGEYEPTEGAVHIAKGKSLGMLTQNAAPDGELTILEEACSAFPELLAEEERLKELQLEAERGDSGASGLADAVDRFSRKGGYEFRGRCAGVLKNLGFAEEDFGRRVSTLSGGQKTRLALACLLLRDPDILILDEPTNHLDTDALFWLENRLLQSHRTIIVISHDRYFLDSVTNKTLELEYGKGKLYNGNYSVFAAKKAADREIAERHYKNQQKEIARIEAYIEQQRRWNRERNIIAAESREKQLAKMERVAKPEALPENMRLRFSVSGESGEDALTLRGLTKGYGGKTLFSDVKLIVKKRERLFVTGPNGCGKSTLIKCIAGRLKPDFGETDYGAGVRIGYYDQENQELNPDNTVLDEVWNDYAGMNLTDVRNVLAQFLFCGDDVMKKVSLLSGGERARLTLAKLILTKMNLLILDEPTNHLDIGSREVLEEALSEFDGTIIAVSHDRYFIKKLATRILSFPGGGGELTDFKGNYTDYLSYRERSAESAKESSKPQSEGRERFLAEKQAQAEQRKEEKRRRMLEEKIEKTETRISEIDEEMNGPAASDAARLIELGNEKERLETELMELYEKTMG